MDSRHQRNICQIVHKFFTKFKKIYKIHTKLLQPEGAAPGTPVHTRPQAIRNGAGLSHRKKRREQRLCSTLGQPTWPPRAVPLSFAHVHAALLDGEHAPWASRPPTRLPREKPWGTTRATTRPNLSGWFSIDGWGRTGEEDRTPSDGKKTVERCP